MLSRLWAALGRFADSLHSLADSVRGFAGTIRLADTMLRDRLEMSAQEPAYLPAPSQNGVAHPQEAPAKTPETIPAALPKPSQNRRRGSR